MPPETEWSRPSSCGGDDGTDFALLWREDFDGPLNGEWTLANWTSPLGNSEHSPANVNVVDGKVILSLTEDGATALTTPPVDPADTMEPEIPEGNGGTSGQGGTPTMNGGANSGGSSGAATAGASGVGGLFSKEAMPEPALSQGLQVRQELVHKEGVELRTRVLPVRGRCLQHRRPAIGIDAATVDQ